MRIFIRRYGELDIVMIDGELRCYNPLLHSILCIGIHAADWETSSGLV